MALIFERRLYVVARWASNLLCNPHIEAEAAGSHHQRSSIDETANDGDVVMEQAAGRQHWQN